MTIKYKFLSANPAEQTVEVRFYSDAVPEAELATYHDADGNITRCRTDLNISLPVPAPTGADLEAYILQFAPTTWLDTLAKFKGGNDDPVLAAVQAQVGQEFVPGVTPPLSAQVAVQPVYTSFDAVKTKKLADLAYWRYRTEVGGVLFNGAMIKTDRESQAQLNSAYTSLKNGLLTEVKWKAGDGVFVTLDVNGIGAVAAAVAQHVQASFVAEQQYSDLINACTTVEQLNALVLPA